MSNKIKYGLSKAYYAKIKSVSETGVPTYDTPILIPGAVSITFNASGSTDIFYADNIAYNTINTNSGYSGDVEFALIPDSFKIDILGDKKDKNGMLIENSDAVTSEFAFLFQVEGDVNAKRFCFWRCSASRPSIEAKTKEEKTDPATDKLTLTLMAREDNHNIKSTAVPTDTIYETWYTTVPEAVFEETSEG